MAGWWERWRMYRQARRLARGREGALQIREQLRAQLAESLTDFRELAQNTKQHVESQRAAAERMLEALKTLEETSASVDHGVQSAAGVLEKVEQHCRDHVRMLTEAAEARRETAGILREQRAERRRSRIVAAAGLVVLCGVLIAGFAYLGNRTGRATRRAHEVARELGQLREGLEGARARTDRLTAEQAIALHDLRAVLERLAPAPTAPTAAVPAEDAAPPPEPTDTGPGPGDAGSWWNPADWF